MIDASQNDDTFNVNDLFSTLPLRIEGNNGNDIFNVADGDLDADIRANVIFNGDGGDDTLNIDDSTDAGNDTYTLDFTTLTKTSFSDTFTFSSMQNIVLDANPGNNAVNLDRVSSTVTGAFTVNGNDGNDTVFVGGGDYDNNTSGDVIVNGGLGIDRLVIEDASDTADDSYTFDLALFSKSSETSTTTYSNIEDVELEANTGSNVINLERFAATVADVLIEGNNGDDTFRVGAVNLGDLDTNVSANLVLNGNGGTNVVILDDRGDTLNDSYTFDGGTFGGAQTFTKSSLGGDVYTSIAIAETTLYANDGSNTINVNGMGVLGFGFTLQNDLTVAAGDGNDTINIGNGDINPVIADVFVDGNAGFDRVNINDASETGTRTYDIGSGGFDRSGWEGSVDWISGLISPPRIEALTVNAGTSNDTINVNGLGGSQFIIGGPPIIFPVDLVINAGSGNDDILVAASAQRIDSLSGDIVVNGNAGTDDLIFLDGLDTGNDTYTLTSTALVKNTSTYSRTFSGLEELDLQANLGNNTIDVNSTFNGAISVKAGGGNDNIDINGKNIFAPPVFVDGEDGLDQIYADTAIRMFTSQTLSQFVLDDGGRATFDSITPIVLETDFLSINTNAGGFLDIADNALIVDFGGVSPLGTIAALIDSGYNGGAWNGAGINTSFGNANQFALGYGDSADLLGGAGSFAGRPVDATATLVRYTRYGDANLDGTVSILDFARLRGGFGSGSLWSEGDFNYDDTVSILDFALLRANFGQTV